MKDLLFWLEQTNPLGIPFLMGKSINGEFRYSYLDVPLSTEKLY